MKHYLITNSNSELFITELNNFTNKYPNSEISFSTSFKNVIKQKSFNDTRIEECLTVYSALIKYN